MTKKAEMGKVYITDYVENPDLERGVLGEMLCSEPCDEVEAIIVWHQKVDREYIDRFPKLKGIIRYGVGYDNIDLKYARSKGIVACNTPDYGTDEVSDTAIAMIMNIVRGISRYDHQCRVYRDDWQEHVIPAIRRTGERRLGVIGAGRIGGSVLLKASALGLQTCFFDPYKPRGYEKMLNSGRVDTLEALWGSCDLISIHTPLNEETEAMVNDAFIASMKPGSSLVNTARGGILKSVECLYEPLKNDHLESVALDVLPEEPPGDSRLLDAWRNREDWLDGRFIVNPHSAYYSGEAYIEMRTKAASNAKRVLDGLEPFNILT